MIKCKILNLFNCYNFSQNFYLTYLSCVMVVVFLFYDRYCDVADGATSGDGASQ